MKILPRTYLGEPILRARAARVPRADLKKRTFKNLVGGMFHTMHAARGVGLAAPQIGISRRLAVIELKVPGRRDIPAWPKTVIINPEIVAKSKKTVDDWEGCLSFPGLKGIVPRHTEIRVRYLDLQGRTHSASLKGYIARVFQHEIDHLNGLIYIDRMKSMKSLGFTANPFKRARPVPQQRHR